MCGDKNKGEEKMKRKAYMFKAWIRYILNPVETDITSAIACAVVIFLMLILLLIAFR